MEPGVSTRQQLLDASEVLEALRPQAGNVLGGANQADDPIRRAWALALQRYRAACDAWVTDPS
jgi:hypothetical protein